MRPSLSARLFAIRIRALVGLRGLLASLDGADVLAILALAGVGVGVALVTDEPGWGLLSAAALLTTITPLGTGVRLLLRGK